MKKAMELIGEGALVINVPSDGSCWSYGVEGINTYFRRSSDNGRGGAEESKILRTQLRDISTSEEVQRLVNDLDSALRADARRAGKRPSHHDDHPLQRGELARHRNHRRADTGLQAASQRRRHAALRDRGVALAILSCAKRGNGETLRFHRCRRACYILCP